MGKCLSCNLEIDNSEYEREFKWCSISCKKDFYLKYFAGNVDVKIWELDHDADFKDRQKRVMKEVKESGMSFCDFIRSLGDFKEDVKLGKAVTEEKE